MDLRSVKYGNPTKCTEVWKMNAIKISAISYSGCYFYVPHRRGGEHIVFGADPVCVGVSVSVGVGVTLSCLHDISRYLIFKVTAGLKLPK